MNNTTAKGRVPSFQRRFYKRLTMMLFFILPSRLSKVLVNLWIILLVFKVREESIQEHEDTIRRIGNMLHVNLNENVLMLPGKTCQWYWSDDVLDKPLELHGEKQTLRSMILDKGVFIKNRGFIIDKLIDCLPKSISIKIGLGHINNRLMIKHNITTALMYS